MRLGYWLLGIVALVLLALAGVAFGAVPLTVGDV